MDIITKRRNFEVLRSQLENEYSTFKSHHRELSDYILPRRSRFEITDVNKGDKRNRNIIDSTATLAVRTLRSGMMSGVTSPARPWFRLTTPDPALAEVGSVKAWLHNVQNIMSTTFLKTNLYNILPIVYGDMGVFGTAALYVEEDFDNVMHFHSFPIGSFYIAKDVKGRVNTFIREFRMTVRQVVDTYGVRDRANKLMWDNMSLHVQNLWDSGHTETWIDIVHVIKPNDKYDPKKVDAKHKKYQSCYYERGTYGAGGNYIVGGDENKYLRESGYDYFPVLCPRWETSGEDVYGTDCPGMTALADIRQLQVMEKRIAQAIDKMVNPPMIGHYSLRNQKASILPGDITYVDLSTGTTPFRPAHEVNSRVLEVEQKQAQIRDRIRRAFFEDLFLMLASSDRRQITAREIDERHEEKLLALGPVLEQLNQDLLDPLIDIAFDLHFKQGYFNQFPLPEELQGVDLKVEYISMMSQAQKLIGISGIERFVGFVSQVAGADPSVLDKINKDQLIDTYADITSVPPNLVLTDDQVSELRAQRAQAQAAQQQQMQQMEMLKSAASSAKDLAATPLDENNALGRMLANAQSGALV